MIDRQNYLPVFFTSIANTWSRGASKVFLHRFGVGALDWVVMSMLAIEPGISALQIRQGTSADKASVSRCISQLEQKRLIRGVAEGRDVRRRTLELTAEGYALHDQLMAIAVRREQQLLEGLTEADVGVLLGLLRQLKQNILLIQERDAASVALDGAEAW